MREHFIVTFEDEVGEFYSTQFSTDWKTDRNLASHQQKIKAFYKSLGLEVLSISRLDLLPTEIVPKQDTICDFLKNHRILFSLLAIGILALIGLLETKETYAHHAESDIRQKQEVEKRFSQIDKSLRDIRLSARICSAP